MPYRIRKVRNKKCYRVTNAITGRVHAYCTTRKKAEAQVKIMLIKSKKKY